MLKNNILNWAKELRDEFIVKVKPEDLERRDVTKRDLRGAEVFANRIRITEQPKDIGMYDKDTSYAVIRTKKHVTKERLLQMMIEFSYEVLDYEDEASKKPIPNEE